MQWNEKQICFANDVLVKFRNTILDLEVEYTLNQDWSEEITPRPILIWKQCYCWSRLTSCATSSFTRRQFYIIYFH